MKQEQSRQKQNKSIKIQKMHKTLNASKEGKGEEGKGKARKRRHRGCTGGGAID